MDVHTKLLENKWLHGMEIANGASYYPRAHQWCLDRGLTMMGTSDIHQPDLNEKTTAERHRTMTLVFVKERTLDGLKEALMAGRTAVWFADRMIGRPEYLEPLFEASVEVVPPHSRTGNNVWFRVKNHCAMDIRLMRNGDLGPMELNLPALSTTLVRITTRQPNESMELDYTATSFWIAPETGLPVVLKVLAAE
jgi:3',5'-nucleoside bisphosphate phosphatase